MTFVLPSRHEVKVGADGAYLEAQIRNEGDEPFDLTGLVVTVDIMDERGNVVTSAGTCDILNNTEGRVLYTHTSGEVASARRLYVRFKASGSGAGGGGSGWSGPWSGPWSGESGGTTITYLHPTQGHLIVDVT